MPPYRNTGPGSPSSPSSSIHKPVPVGFLPSNRRPPKLDQLSRRELLDIYNRNKAILDEPSASTSSYHQRIVHEQADIEGILGMETLQAGLTNTHITSDDPMGMETSSSPPSRTVEAKRRAIGRYHNSTSNKGSTMALGLDEAMLLEQQATLAARERKKQEEERRQRKGLPIKGEILTQQQREAKIWAFMNARPTESDEEDEDWNLDEEEDEDDPSNWFESEYDEENPGHPLVDPDDIAPEELAEIIRVDNSRFS